MSGPSRESRQMEHNLISQLAGFDDHRAAGLRRSFLNATAADLRWRQGDREASALFYQYADGLALGDMGKIEEPMPSNQEDGKPTYFIVFSIFISGFALGVLAAVMGAS